jgi:transcription elongation factor SPT6
LGFFFAVKIDEDDEEGDFQREARKRQRQRQRKTLHKIEDIFEPQELEKNLLTEHDQQIRIEDKPERFMLRTVPVTSEPDEYELEREAEWIFRHAFQMPTITAQVSNQVQKQTKKIAVKKNNSAFNTY